MKASYMLLIMLIAASLSTQTLHALCIAEKINIIIEVSKLLESFVRSSVTI